MDKLLNKKFIINILIILLITLQTFWYAILWFTYFRSSDLLLESDFRAFYSVGLIAKDFNFNQVYDLDLENHMQERITGNLISKNDLLTYNHPPLLLPVLALLANFPYQTAYLFYSLLLLLMATISLHFFYTTLRSKRWTSPWIWLTLIAVMLFEPTFISILKGQDTVLLLLGLVIWFTGLLKDDDRHAGLGLALTTIRPQISLFLAIPFLFRKRKVFAWYFLGAVSLILYCYFLVGRQGFLDYMALLKLSSEGQNFGLNLSAMFNLTGLILRIFPGLDLNILNFLKWGFYGISLAGMVLLWRRNQKIEIRHIGILVISCLFFSPHLHFHDLAALLIPILGMLFIWVNGSVIQEKTAPIIILIISITFLIGEIISPLYHILPILIMIFLLVGSWNPELFLLHNRDSSKKME